MDEKIKEIFDRLSDQLSAEEFEQRVEDKMALMGGLCDKRTAAMLVAREFGEIELKINQIKPDTGKVIFVGKVISISEVHEFDRTDGSLGRVTNLSLGDETGSIRVVLWDEATKPVSDGKIKVGQVLKVMGITRDGYFGTEVNADQCGVEEADADIQTRIEPFKISEIKPDMGDINLVTKVVDPGEAREFLRKDGSMGLVRSVILGDETGKIRLTLWNEKAEMKLVGGESLEVINALSRERYGQVEIQAGSYSVIRKSDAQVNYVEKITPISELKAESISSISGFVTGFGEVREFERDNGTVGKVANIYISDHNDRVRVTLWNDHVKLIEDLDIGTRIELIDGQVKTGWNNELEVSCGWGTKITFAPPEN
ncbi:MAG: OB-fold nucleic acid binding domain-containing protein [Methanotrichaceae archaeon]